MFQLSKFVLANQEPRVYTSERFFERDLYELLVESFPIAELKEKMGSGFFAEIDGARHKSEFKSILQSRSAWNKVFHKIVTSGFRKQLLLQFRSELSEVRGFESAMKLASRDTEIKCSFHMSRNGYLLSPHTDTAKKLITIVIYFGDCSEELIGAGTRFYRSRDHATGREYLLSRLDSEDHLELNRSNGIVGAAVGRIYEASDRTIELEAELKQFDLIHDCVFKSSFIGNQAVLFVKSNSSWHDVRLDSLADGQVRCSFVVNFSLSTNNRWSLLRKFVTFRR